MLNFYVIFCFSLALSLSLDVVCKANKFGLFSIKCAFGEVTSRSFKHEA